MKNTKKLLVGVLSVAALLGTGVAAWTIGGELTNDSKEVKPTVETEVFTRDLALDITAVDETILFDSNADLSVDYKVKAIKGGEAADDFDPYNLDNYKKVAAEYEPDLTVSVKAIDATTSEELDSNDPFFTYVKLPKAQEIHYEDWLADEYKDKGYPVNITLEWGEKYGNPQDYIDTNPEGWDQAKQREWINSVVADLQNVNFQFLFEVKGVEGEDVPPVEEETGAVTLPEVAGSTLSIDGYDPEKGTVTAGTHTITITTDEGKVVKNKKLTIMEGETPVEVDLEESPLTRAVGHTYTYEHEFKAGVVYSFDYSVVNEEVTVTEYTVTYTKESTSGTITVTNEAGAVTSGAKVVKDSKITVKVEANRGFKIDTVTIGVDVQTVNNSTFEKEYTVTSDLTISAVYSEISTEPEDPMANYEVFQSGRFGTYNKSLKESYYFTGKMDSYYLATSTNFADGVVVTSYKNNENYYLRFDDPESGTKKYIGANYDSGHYNILIQDEPYAWSYDETYNAYTGLVNNKKQFIGSYTFNTLSLQQYQYIDENSIAVITEEEIVVEATGLLIKASSNEVEVGKSITLSKTVTPDYAPGEVIYEVLEGGTGEVTLKDNKVTGVAEGKVQIVGKIGNVTSEPITITVTPKSEDPVGTMSTTYTMLKGDGTDNNGDNRKFVDLIGEDGSNIDGTDIVDNDATGLTKAYPAYADGAKFGSSKATGELNFVLKSGFELVGIELKACSHGSDDVTLKIGENVEYDLTKDLEVYSAEFNPGVTSVSIKGHKANSCRYYIEYIKFTYTTL